VSSLPWEDEARQALLWSWPGTLLVISQYDICAEQPDQGIFNSCSFCVISDITHLTFRQDFTKQTDRRHHADQVMSATTL
jgi:hypothetical protein